MKKVVMFLSLIMACSHILYSQELTVEYNIGYGKFCMRDLRHYMTDDVPEIYNSVVLKNFPGNVTHQAKIGVELNPIHQFGVSMDFMSTEGRTVRTFISELSDYEIDYRTNGTRVGVFYRITPSKLSTGVIRPYFMLTAGVVISNNSLKTFDEPEYEPDYVLNGAMAFAEPALGCKIRLHENFALNINAGYHIDLDMLYRYENHHHVWRFDHVFHSYEDNCASPTWGGLRAQAGFIFYIPLGKK